MSNKQEIIKAFRKARTEGEQMLEEVEEYILIDPDSEAWSKEGMGIAIKALEEMYDVHFESEPLKRRDHGFGAEMAYIISGEKNDVDFVLSEIEEWASQFTEDDIGDALVEENIEEE